MDRRTACLHQADAFREKALADPEHHDQWIDKAIKWLERAMEASCRATITVEADKGSHAPEANRTPLIETLASHRRIIARSNRRSRRTRRCGNCSRDVTMLRVDTVPAAMLGRALTVTRVTSCSPTASPQEPAARAIGAECCPC
ncbi:hypothetical protein WI560_13890 [Bradyrhizobium sp. A11]|uniref:hypothetical protein n=1 Tax=Bradyrhizobium sp. A11 TaxID=3133974 RepID=UPI00324768BB